MFELQSDRLGHRRRSFWDPLYGQYLNTMEVHIKHYGSSSVLSESLLHPDSTHQSNPS